MLGRNLEYLEHAEITVIKFTAPMTLSFCNWNHSVPPSHWLVVGLIVAQSMVEMNKRMCLDHRDSLRGYKEALRALYSIFKMFVFVYMMVLFGN